MKRSLAMPFLNVDLEIAADQPLTPLINALSTSVVVLHHQETAGQYWATLELALDPIDPDTAIATFSELIAALPETARNCWNYLTLRQFDIGYDGPQTAHPLQLTLAPSTLQKLTEMGGSLAVTVYPYRDETQQL